MRGVAFRVPHVISCFTAAGPSSDGVGDGMVGTREKLLIFGDLGRSRDDSLICVLDFYGIRGAYMEYRQ